MVCRVARISFSPECEKERNVKGENAPEGDSN
jgi:hypothetical protein